MFLNLLGLAGLAGPGLGSNAWLSGSGREEMFAASRGPGPWRVSVLGSLFGLLLLAGVMQGCSDDDVGADRCGLWECGEVDGVSCGECSGSTEACHAGLCVDVCQDRECGEVEGLSCGECSGSTEVCTESGHCMDVCEGRNCGRVGDISCGTCPWGAVCNTVGQCVQGACPPDMVAIWDLGICMDAHPMTSGQAVALANEFGPICGEDVAQSGAEGKCDIFGNGVSEYHGRWTVEPGKEDLPARVFTWGTAASLCDWQGKRLCYLEELTSACAGPEGHEFPYGDEQEHCRCIFAEYGCAAPDASVYADTDCEGGYEGLYTMLGPGGYHTATCTATPNGPDCKVFAGSSSGCFVEGGLARAVRCCKDLDPL